MVDELAEWWQHDCTVVRKSGTSGYQDVFDPPAVIRGFFDGGQRMVRSSTGDQTFAQATVFFPPTTAFIPLESLITAPEELGGVTGKVVLCTLHKVGDMDLPTHWEVLLS